MSDIKIRYVDRSTYDEISHDSDTIYVVEYDTEISIYYNDKIVSNTVYCSELPQEEVAIEGCLYLCKTESKLCLYYFYSKNDIKQFIPLFDSTIQSFKSTENGVIITDLLGSHTIIGVDSNDLPTPATVLDQIVDTVGSVDIRPIWKLWE